MLVLGLTNTDVKNNAVLFLDMDATNANMSNKSISIGRGRGQIKPASFLENSEGREAQEKCDTMILVNIIVLSIKRMPGYANLQDFIYFYIFFLYHQVSGSKRMVSKVLANFLWGNYSGQFLLILTVIRFLANEKIHVII